jgi:hypothetical protein
VSGQIGRSERQSLLKETSGFVQLAAEDAHELPGIVGLDHHLDQLAPSVVESRDENMIPISFGVSRRRCLWFTNKR